MRTTTFARWLREHGETSSSFAIRTGFNNQVVYWLTGKPRSDKPVLNLSLALLGKISQETGISERRLAGEAIVAAKNGKARNGG